MRALLPIVLAGALALPSRVDAQERRAREARGGAVFHMLPFFGMAGYYAIWGDSLWASPGWSVAELLHASVYLSVAVANATDDRAGWRKNAVLWGMFGTGLLVHGVMSLVYWELPGTSRSPPGGARTSLTTTPDGIALRF